MRLGNLAIAREQCLQPGQIRRSERGDQRLDFLVEATSDGRQGRTVWGCRW